MQKKHDRIQYSLVIKILRKLERNYFNMIKVIYRKPTANIFNGKRLEDFL